MRQRRRRLSAVFAAGSLTLLVLWSMGQGAIADVAAGAGQTGRSAHTTKIALMEMPDSVGPLRSKDKIIPSVALEDVWIEREKEEEDEEVHVEGNLIPAPLPAKATSEKKLRQLDRQGKTTTPSPPTMAATATVGAAAPLDPAVVVPTKETRILPWETKAWQRDLVELNALLDMDIEPAAIETEASSLAAGIGSDGHFETMGSMGNLMNLLSPSPDPAWPFCSPVGILYKTGLVCPVMNIAAKILMRSPPDFEKLTTEHHCPNPTGELPEQLEELREGGLPMPMIIPKEVVEREKPTYAWYLTHVYNM